VLYGKESVKIDLKRLSTQIIDYFGELEPCLSIDTLNATPKTILFTHRAILFWTYAMPNYL